MRIIDLGLNLFIEAFVIVVAVASPVDENGYSRHDFPGGFVFGAATSAYQVEGAANLDGRSPSIFDTYAKTGITGGGTGDVSCDQYHKYKEDVQLMVDTSLDAYRFSISWSRLIPDGRGPVNPKGLQYYNSLIDELISKGIQPHVTLHHFDLPQVLEDEYGGWTSRRVVKDFASYAEVCFKMFGDRVKYWTTINEANIFSWAGYDLGFLPPMRCSFRFVFNCTRGNSSTEPYLATHFMLLSHAAAVKIYKNKYQKTQMGQIGINLYGLAFLPYTDNSEDVAAMRRAYDFHLGWYLDPLNHGDYPTTMKKNVGSRIPLFTAQESRLIKGSYDFIGLNFYTSMYTKDNPAMLEFEMKDFFTDSAVEMRPSQANITSTYLSRVNGSWPSHEYPVKPWSLQSLLEYIKENYGNPPLFIHENGQRTVRNSSLEDTSRVEFLQGYIGAVLDSVRNGSNTKGYFTWSLLDVFEPVDGYSTAFGLYYVDLDDPELTRYPKLSARWFSNFLKGGIVCHSAPGGLILRTKNPSSTSIKTT
ncbi:hypothetical protein MLD38_004141 [Melastoma candidum]|uniref:Uncharacterized protein n=1 Tax=Melastoma candidum TaxID=119954 RepID=A0ACB9S6Q4_9MYRT|nr:hypothetical protein MLD38_004141 [Melastoma candidum]